MVNRNDKLSIDEMYNAMKDSNKDYLELIPPKEFNFNECLVYLNRSNNECLHEVVDNALYKLVKLDGEIILLKVTSNNKKITIEFPANKPNKAARKSIVKYVWELFDLDRDLTGFYEIAENDGVLNTLAKKYYGLRIVGIPDLFEALAWAIMGQQINLAFAYTLKRRFVEKYGENYIYKGKIYWLFPKPEVIAEIEICDLTNMQFTTKKAEYVIGIAKAIVDKTLNKIDLLKMRNHGEMQKSLVSLRGIGKWSADYAIMRCLKNTESFPIADVGLQNALKILLDLDKKPAIDEIKEMARNWKGWEAYATFYLWRSLYE